MVPQYRPTRKVEETQIKGVISAPTANHLGKKDKLLPPTSPIRQQKGQRSERVRENSKVTKKRDPFQIEGLMPDGL